MKKREILQTPNVADKEIVFYCHSCQRPPIINENTQELAIKHCPGCVRHTQDSIIQWLIAQPIKEKPLMGEIVENKNSELLKNYDKKIYKELLPEELLVILENQTQSNTPLWIEVLNTDRLGSLYIAVDGRRNTLSFAIPPQDTTIDQLGTMTNAGEALVFYGTHKKLPIKDFVFALNKFVAGSNLIDAIHTAEKLVRNMYRNQDNTVPLPSTSFLTLDGEFGAKEVIIRETLIAPQQPAGYIYEEVENILTNGFQKLPNILETPYRINGEVVGSNDIGYLTLRLSQDYRGDTLIFSFCDHNHGVPFFTAKYFSLQGEEETYLSHLDIYRHTLSEKHNTQILESKHLQIADELRYSWGLIRPEGVALKNEVRVLQTIQNGQFWSNRFGDELEVNDPWVKFEAGLSVDQEKLKKMIIDYLDSLIPIPDTNSAQISSTV
ncbi:hypothetical protein KKD03_01395 [Patescibacteria group bacterium]|nr:hypothetical protein [Patescibacteria group bacterium]